MRDGKSGRRTEGGKWSVILRGENKMRYMNDCRRTNVHSNHIADYSHLHISKPYLQKVRHSATHLAKVVARKQFLR